MNTKKYKIQNQSQQQSHACVPSNKFSWQSKEKISLSFILEKRGYETFGTFRSGNISVDVVHPPYCGRGAIMITINEFPLLVCGVPSLQ